MRPAKYDIYIRAGDDFVLPLKIRSETTGLFFTVTGWTGTAQVRATPETSTVAGTFTVTCSGDTVTVSMDETGTRACYTALLAAGNNGGVWDLQLVNAGFTRTWIEGAVTAVSDVTRP